MPRFVALLRSINVGGNSRLKMADLAAACKAAGFRDVSTIVQTGNALFEADGVAPDIETALETALKQRLDMTVDVIARTREEWLELVERNPMPAECERDPSHVLLVTLKTIPSEGGFERLAEASKGPETMTRIGRELWIYYPTGIGTSKLTTRLMESRLKTKVTARNWNTVRKVSEAFAKSDEAE